MNLLNKPRAKSNLKAIPGPFARINHSHILSKNLEACFLFNQNTGLKTYDRTKYRNRIDWTANPFRSGPIGTAAGFSNTSSYGELKKADGSAFTADQSNNEITVIALMCGYFTMAGRSVGIIAGRDDYSSNRKWSFSYNGATGFCNPPAYNNVYGFYCHDGSNSGGSGTRIRYSTANAYPPATNRTRIITGVYNGTVHDVYVGKLKDSGTLWRDSCASTSIAATRQLGTQTPVRILNNAANLETGNIWLYGLWIYSRALSESEIQRFNDNPWQNFYTPGHSLYAFPDSGSSESGSGTQQPAENTPVLELEKISLRKISLSKLSLSKI